jgi:hypothetical protein
VQEVQHKEAQIVYLRDNNSELLAKLNTINKDLDEILKQIHWEKQTKRALVYKNPNDKPCPHLKRL